MSILELKRRIESQKSEVDRLMERGQTLEQALQKQKQLFDGATEQLRGLENQLEKMTLNHEQCKSCSGIGFTGNDCQKCRGFGSISDDCPQCKGEGYEVYNGREIGCDYCYREKYISSTCNVCGGNKKELCHSCQGNGMVKAAL